MANQAKQVFYVTDPSNTWWTIFLQGKHLPDSTDENQDFNYETSHCLTTYVRQSYEENNIDDVHVICRDHEEGIREN